MENEKKNKIAFLVECKVPTVMTEEFSALIPQQQQAVMQAMMNGSVVSHFLSEDHTRAWFVIAAEDKLEVRRIMRAFPLTRFLKIRISKQWIMLQLH